MVVNVDQKKFIRTIQNKTNVRISILRRSVKLYSTQILDSKVIRCNSVNLTSTGFWYDTEAIDYYKIMII